MAAQNEGHSSGNVFGRLPSGCEIRTGGNLTHRKRDGASVAAGVQVQLKEKCLASLSVNKLYRSVAGFRLDEGEVISGQNGNNVGVSRAVSQGEICETQGLSQTLGLNSISSGRCSPRQATYKGFPALGIESPAGPTYSRSPQNLCYFGLCADPTPMAQTGFSDTRHAIRHNMCPVSNNNRHISVGLGRHARGQIGERSMGTEPMHSTHKCPGANGGVPGSETFSTLRSTYSCVSQNGQHHSSGLYQQTRGASLPSVTQASTQTDTLEQCQPSFAQGHACAWSGQPRGGSTLRFQRECSVSPVLFVERHRGPVRVGPVSA